MAGIYLHIPFCKKACHYCDFHFSTTQHLLPEMVKAISLEAALQKDYLQETVETIYFGGGTPSILSAEYLITLLEALHQHFDIDPLAEITLEANPDDINESKAVAWKQAGVNRLSIGIQSFDEKDLSWMNRAHTAKQAKEAIEVVQKAGFENLTIDLMYGTPTLTDEQWGKNVFTAIAYGIHHLSCYALTVEPATALAKMINKKTVENVDTDKQAKHFQLLTGWLQAAGFEHYEISNFAKPGYRSRHNTSYWKGRNYLGLGPSAHSFNGQSRQWNISNNALYLTSIMQGTIPFEIETLTLRQQFNEYIMTGLRTLEGISLRLIEERWGQDYKEATLVNCRKHITSGNLECINNQVRLTVAGKFMADGIAADLFSV
jgi:oxygen-independent coproporphyrinogen-3 oxidase